MSAFFARPTREQEAIAMLYATEYGSCDVSMSRTKQMGDTMHITCDAGSFTYNEDGVQTGGRPMPDFTLKAALG